MDLEIQLSQLVNAQLVRHLVEEESAYLFKHALTQESAYASLLLKRRREIHLRVAESFVQAYPERLDENAGVLAHHFAEGGDDVKTVEYATRAGEVAARHSANLEARSYYDLALEALSHLPGDEQNRQRRLDLALMRIAVSLRAEGPQRSLARLLEAEALALKLYGPLPAGRDDRLKLARLHYWMAQAYLHGNQLHDAVRYLEEVLAVAQTEGDEELAAIPESMLGRALAIQGHFPAAEAHLRSTVLLLGKIATNHEWFMAVGILGGTLAARGSYKAAETAGDIFAQGLAQRIWAGALAASTPVRYDEADSHLAVSLRSFESGDACLEAARTHVDWGKVFAQRGSAAQARKHLEMAAAQFKASGLEKELDGTRAVLDDVENTA
jgi:tetratricopeptide (TPR) repeat protein